MKLAQRPTTGGSRVESMGYLPGAMKARQDMKTMTARKRNPPARDAIIGRVRMAVEDDC